MILVNWQEEIEKRLIKKGLSLSTSESILMKHKEYFNEVLREIMLKFPNKRLFNIIMAIRDHYEIEFIALDMLDDYNKIILKKQTSQEYNI